MDCWINRWINLCEARTVFDSQVCDPGAQYFGLILWIYKGGLNLFGVVIAAKTWNCADGVGEVRRGWLHALS